MKYFLSTIILMSAIIFSCHNDANKDLSKYRKSTFDTANVLVSTIAPDLSKVLPAIVVQRIIVDSFMYKDVDSVTLKKQMVKDTFYRVPYPSWIDTVKNIIAIDSLPNSYKGFGYWVTDKKFVKSGWDNFDSAVAYLNKFIKTRPVANK